MWSEPRVIIGDVPMIQHEFSWSLTAGPSPYFTSFVVPNGPLDNQLKAVPNPTTIKLEVFGGTNFTGFQSRVLEFNQVYLMQGKGVDDFHTMWQLGDVRFSWRGKKFYCAYNKTRQKNEIGISVTSPILDPASLRAAIDTYSVGRYLPWSVKNDGKPFSIKEILEIEMGKMDIDFDSTVSQADHSYIVENVELEGVDVYSGFANLLARSRMNLGILPNGKVYVYSIDYFDGAEIDLLLQAQAYEKTGPGILYRQELSRIRPQKVTVKFEKKVETKLVASTSQNISYEMWAPTALPLSSSGLDKQEDIELRRVLGCENIVRVPVPYSNFKVGEYIPMWRLLEAIGVSDASVRTLWFSSRLEFHIALLLTTISGGIEILGNYNLAMQLANAIKSHYRQCYQIDPYYVDQIKFWEARRVSIIDNYSHFSPPSPLWADYCIIPRVRTPSVAKNTASWAHLSYNWVVTDEDPYRQRPTLGTVVVENEALGIFRVSYPPDLTQNVEAVIPSAIDNLPGISPSASKHLWSQANLREQHTLETIISVVWQADSKEDTWGTTRYNFAGKYYPVSWDYGTGTGPNIEYLSRMEFARFPLRQFNNDGAEAVDYDPAIPLNEKIITALAASEAAKIMNQFRDRVVGQVKMAGAQMIKLNGNLKSVTYTFGEGGLQTIIDMRDTPPDPTLEQTLPQDTINYLHKHVTRGDTANEIRK